MATYRIDMQAIPSFSPNSGRRFALVMAFLAVSIGFVGLCGWIFDSFTLKSFLSDGATMKVDTSLMIIAGGCSLLLLYDEKRSLAVILLILTILFAFLILVEHLGNVQLYIDNWWFKDKDTDPFLEVPGRTSALTAINILFMASAMLLAAFKRYYASQYMAALLFLLVYAALLGHLFGVTGFYHQGKYSGVAFHTALSLFLLDLGILFYQAGEGWVQLFFQHLRGRNMVIYIFCYLLCAAPLLVAFYLFMINHDRFSPASGIIVLIVISALISIPAAYLVLNRLNRMDTQLKKANEQLEIAIAASGMGIWDLDLQTGEVQRSTRHAAIFGHDYTPFTTAGALMEQFHPDDRPRVEAAFEAARQTGTLNVRTRILIPGEQEKWIQIYGKTGYDLQGKPVRLLGSMMDITEQKEIETKKDAFIGMISHELKTPLTSFKSYVQLVLARAKKSGDEFAINMLTRAEVQTNKMATMIQGFLDVTRLDSGKLKLEPEPFDMHPLLEDVAHDAQLLTDGHTIEVENCAESRVIADREKIAQVVVNLVNNSIKYSPNGTKITLSCHKGPQFLNVTVADEGIGIENKDKARLFERFYRADRKEFKTVSGFGIGLYLSAEIIKLHHGEIGVDSEEGKGSTFWFTLPLN